MTVTRQEYEADWPRSYEHSNRTLSGTLPGTSARLELDRRNLRVIDDDGSTTELPPLNSGDDYSGWGSFHILSHGWLYVSGAQYDSALRIERRDRRWALTQNIRIRARDQGLLDGLARWLLKMDAEQIRRDGLTGIVAKGGLRFYSRELRTMFLEDGEKLEDGRFLPLGKGQMRWYYGDIALAKVALLKDLEHRVYSYDGETFAALGGPPVQDGWINQPKPLARTFLGIGSPLLEVRGARHGALNLVEIKPAEGIAPGWLYAVVLRDERLLFVGRHAIYELEGDELRPVWRPSGGHIFGPKDANRFADRKLLITVEHDKSPDATTLFLLDFCQHN